MRYLSVSADAKTVKGQKKGYLTGILYLAPADESGVINTCPYASEGCKATCLYTAGRAAIFPAIGQARVRRTKELVAKGREAFLVDLEHDVKLLVKQAKAKRLIPCVRLNGTSDMPWMALRLAARFPGVQFYDYTKIPKPWMRVRSNYHLTYSHSETNARDMFDCLTRGINVAMVFSTRRGQPLPETYGIYRVIDGDVSDLRFLDPKQARGVIVGLRAKGKAKKDCSGFVVDASAYLQTLKIMLDSASPLWYHRLTLDKAVSSESTVRLHNEKRTKANG